MRKIVTITDKKIWLAQHESGKSQLAIAKKSKRDVRTITKGIEDARREQDIRLARAELLKEALRKHQDSLEEELRQVLTSLDYPPVDYAPLSWHQGDDSIFSSTRSPELEEESRQSSRAGRRAAKKVTTAHDLLKQHLKNDRLLKHLAQWEKALPSHLASRKAMQRKLVAIIGEKTGFKVVDTGISRPFIYFYTAGHLFYKSALNSAFGLRHDGSFEDDIIADTGAGTVRYQVGSILAEVPGREDETRLNLLAAYREFLLSPELTQVVDTFDTVAEAAAAVRQATEELLLLGFIPGQCHICKRLGL